MGKRGRAAGWGSAVTGALSVATLPIAIYLTRFSEDYELLHAAYALPVAALLGIVAVVLARRSRRLDSFVLSGRPGKAAQVGRVLGVIGLCLVASALVALGVYWLLEYVGSRE